MTVFIPMHLGKMKGVRMNRWLRIVKAISRSGVLITTASSQREQLIRGIKINWRVADAKRYASSETQRMNKMKVAINSCWGGFGLSKEAYDYMGIEWDGFGYDFNDESKRSDPKLIECLEALGSKANGDNSKIDIVEIPDDVQWCIHDYDGQESIHERHRVWG